MFIRPCGINTSEFYNCIIYFLHNVYRNKYKAERNFGKILKEDMSAYRDEMIISTKAGYTMWSGPTVTRHGALTAAHHLSEVTFSIISIVAS